MKRNFAIAVFVMLALLSACKNSSGPDDANVYNPRPPAGPPSGPSDSYAIEINMSGFVEGDSVTASPTTGKAGNEITLTYTVANTKINNRLVFSGTNPALAQVDSAGPGTRKYKINEEDAAGGVITINALFSHSDKEFDTIAFADTSNETRIYGDAPFSKAITTTGTGTGAITYSSSDPSVAAVNNAGTVTIRNAGTTAITATKAGDATYDEATAKYTLTVTQLQLTISDPTVTTTKFYDGTTTAAVTVGQLTNKVGSDTVNVDAVANYNSANAGEAYQITVVYHISGADAGNYLKPVNYTVSGTITNVDGSNKQTGAAVSGNPASTFITTNSITIAAVTVTSPNPGNQTVEYAISTASSHAPTNDWQAGLTFSGLTPNTAYYVFARSKGNDSYNSGTVRVSAAITTQAATIIEVSRTTIVDFEADAIGKTYESAKAGSAPTVKVVADPLNSEQKSLQITSTTYNQAAIVPVNLPTELRNYKSFSFRFNLLSSANLTSQSILVYVAKSTADFKQYGFGNPADSQYAQFADKLLGSTPAETIGDNHRNKWTSYTLTISNPGAAIRDLKGDIFIAIGINVQNGADYLIDDLKFEMRDDFTPPPIIVLPAPTPPTTGAVASGNYRNMFVEWGKTEAEVTAKVTNSYNKLFVNGTADEKIFVEVGSDMAYIFTADTNDVRSEGMSYGMMMCLQMNDQARFDKLWKWSKTYMYNETNTGGNNRGYFSWQCDTNGNKKDKGPAPDGEVYFITSLMFAHARWGSASSGIFNYAKEARQIIYDLTRRRPGNGDPWGEPAMFNTDNFMIRFGTLSQSASFTDPSYHLPSFYEIWADELENDYDDGERYGIWSSLADLKTDVDFFRKAAQVSRDFFQKTTHPATGLGPDYANFDGTPNNSGGGGHADFRFDAWRIAMNIGMDYAWWAADPWQVTFADRIQAFFVSKGVTTYGNQWTLSGNQLDPDHSPGLVGCNAVASLAASHENAWKFIENFWEIPMTTGKYRYYDGCLYMFSMLHLSGNFKAYVSNTTPSASISPATATFDKKEGEQTDIQVTITPNGNTLVSVKNNTATLTNGSQYTVSGNTVTIKKEYLAAQANGTTTLTFAFNAGKARNIAITIKDTTGGGSGGGGTLKYDSTNWPTPLTVSNSSQLSVTINNGAVSLVKTGSYSTPTFILTFTLEDGKNIGNYNAVVYIKGVSGDLGSKDLRAFLGTTTATQLGSVSSSFATNADFKPLTIPLSGTATGEVQIGFALQNTNPVTYEIKSIELIGK